MILLILWNLANWGLSIYGVGYTIFTSPKPTYPKSMVILILWNLANWGLSICGVGYTIF
jgi:hypothetical protein